MSDLIFDIQNKKLIWPLKKMEWNAVSGPFGAGVLPIGLYDISRKEITQYSNKADIPYQDKTGMGFFLPIHPRFKTQRGKVGGRLGIHPDGNKPGTLGCIGITNSNTRSFYDAVSSTSPNQKLILQVR